MRTALPHHRILLCVKVDLQSRDGSHAVGVGLCQAVAGAKPDDGGASFEVVCTRGP